MATKKETGKGPVKIKMKMSLANPKGAFENGKTYDVPENVPMETAISWVKSGAASKVE